MSPFPLLRWGRAPVPISAAWTEEMAGVTPRAERWEHGRRPGFYCVDQHDRPGAGLPAFKILHGARVRALLAADACQICGARLSFKRMVAAYPDMRLTGRPLVRDGLPMHGGCARLAFEHCPGLQERQQRGALVFLEVRREQCEMVPVLLGPASGPGANPGVNRLVAALAPRPLFSGPDLLIHGGRPVRVAELPPAPPGLVGRMRDPRESAGREPATPTRNPPEAA